MKDRFFKMIRIPFALGLLCFTISFCICGALADSRHIQIFGIGGWGGAAIIGAICFAGTFIPMLIYCLVATMERAEKPKN